MLQITSNRQYTAPAAANAVSVTPSGTAWVNSAWVQLVASMTTSSVLTGVICADHPVVSLTNFPFEVDIGTGSAGSEVAIATLKGQYGWNVFSHGYMSFSIPIDNIASGARVSVRIRTGNTDVGTWKFAITYLRKPIAGTVLVSAKPTKVTAPAGAFHLVPTGASAWANGTWLTLLASASANLVIVGVVIPNSYATNQYEFDIARGASGSEVVLTTVKGYEGGAFADGPGYVPFTNPLTGILSGDRVSARCRTKDRFSGTMAFDLVYMELPL